jgi:sugar lactone lactonase YvrE
MSDLDAGDVVVADLHFPEGLRWHDGALWFSDVFGRTISCLEPAGLRVVANVPGMPSGLGWTPDGGLLAVSMTDRSIVSVTPGGQVEVYADLRHALTELANDMLVDSSGRAYVGNYGYDVDAGAPMRSTHLVRVDPDGSVHVEPPELVFPNGMVLVDEEATLVVAETFGDRLTAVQVGPGGSLSDPRVLVRLPDGSGPDGICVDGRGLIWVPCAYSSRLLAVSREGTIEANLSGGGLGVNCAAVNAAGDTLFVAVAPMDEEEAAATRGGQIIALPL